MGTLKLLLACAAVVGTTVAPRAQQRPEMNEKRTNGRIAVVYFSATGTTRRAAGVVAEATGGTLHEIVPERPYTAADLDWHDRQSRSSREMNDPAARPAIVEDDWDAEAVEVVFLGYPIWWDLAPRVVNTFIESHDLKGKTLVPFATSGGSGIAASVAALQGEYPALDWKAGKLLNRADAKSVREWLDRSGIR